MAKKKVRNRKKSHTKDYLKIVRRSENFGLMPGIPQWNSQGDYFQKFTLYKDTPSISFPGTTYL